MTNMNIQTSKIELVKMILNIENDKFIEKITEFIQKEKVDFWSELSLTLKILVSMKWFTVIIPNVG